MSGYIRDYVAEATAFIDEVYNCQGHDGHGMLGRCPNDVYVAERLTTRTTRAEDLDICLRVTSKPVKVGRNGVAWNGRLYGQFDPFVQTHFGQTVQLRADPMDISRVTVWTLEGAKLCELRANELVPFSTVPNDRLKSAIQEAARHNRAMKFVAKRGMKQTVSPVEILIEQAQEEAVKQQQPDSPPPTIEMIQTGIDGGSDTLRMPLRKAAGGENIDLLAEFDQIDLAPSTRPKPAFSWEDET